MPVRNFLEVCGSRATASGGVWITSPGLPQNRTRMNLLRVAPGWTRPAILAMVLLASAFSAGAESADATDDAFGILLAMPGVQPKPGGWIVSQEAAKDETDLIARLRDLKKEGANFNAVRHGGTLLAHAIRAGKDRTALWLLRNGAGTRKLLSKDDENADDLARKYQRAAVVEVLEGRYGLKPTPPAAPARKPATPRPVASVVAPQTRTEQAIALLERLTSPTRLSSKQASAQASQEWQRSSSTLSQEEFAAVFKDGYHFDSLAILSWGTDDALQEALGRLPAELVRRHAQAIADALVRWSFVTYGSEPRIEYTGAARSWPALWRRIDQPLNYDKAPELAGRIPPEFWPGLFASGYANHEADVTGCLLAAVDLAGLKALWPDFQRDFVDARDEVAGLVLAGYRVDHWRETCHYGSEQSDTAAKLAFLRAQGITAPVYGLRAANPDEPMAPALVAMVQAFTPTQAAKPRLVSVAPDCGLARDERWLDALVKAGPVGWGVLPTSVQLIELPGTRDCGLLVGGDSFDEYPRVNDDFDEGPSRDPPPPRCADAADDGEIWALDRDGIHHVEVGGGTRGSGFMLGKVRDLETGKAYLFDTGEAGATCTLFHGLPRAYEWQAGAKGPTLVPSAEVDLLDKLLRRQCEQPDARDDVDCRGLDRVDAPAAEGVSTLERLRAGKAVPLRDLVDVLGAERRAAYEAALVAHDHAQLGRLMALGIPERWTAAEIRALADADLPLEEKRRRIALLFADPAQLAKALSVDGSDAARTLGPWLPRQDWAPILRLIVKNPASWFYARQRFGAPDGSVVGCDLDHAQGFLCGGGLEPS